jgi:DNA-binding HxlR family transcriptional regulator
MRSGASALSLLSVPLNVHLLCVLQEEERALADLSHAVGLPPASTLRAYLRTLDEWGLVERRQEGAFPGAVSYALTEPGEKLVQTGSVLQRWLKAAPNEAMALGSPAAKSAVKALVDGWEVAIVRALAARPCTLTELDRLIPQVSYPALERRLTAMRKVGLATGRRNGNGRGTPYEATAWLRESVAPLVAATAWERRHAPDRTAAIGRLDVEAAFLLALPALRFGSDLSGSCRLAVELRGQGNSRYAGATATVADGKVSASARLGGDADAWVIGTPSDWVRWVSGRQEEVEIGGDYRLAVALADALRETLTPRQRVQRP